MYVIGYVKYLLVYLALTCDDNLALNQMVPYYLPISIKHGKHLPVGKAVIVELLGEIDVVHHLEHLRP